MEESNEKFLSDVKKYAKAIGDELVEEIDKESIEETEISTERDTEPAEGYIFLHGSHQYAVLTRPDDEFAIIQYPIDLSFPIVAEATKDGRKKIEALGRGEISREEFLEIAKERAAEIIDSPKERNILRAQLIDRISIPGCASELLVFDDTNLIYGVNIEKKIFPDEGLSIADYNEAVQNVVNVGWRAKTYIGQAYGFVSISEESAAEDKGLDTDLEYIG